MRSVTRQGRWYSAPQTGSMGTRHFFWAIDHKAGPLSLAAAIAFPEALSLRFHEFLVAGRHALIHLARSLIEAPAFGLRFVDASAGLFDETPVAGGRALDHETGPLPATAARTLPQTFAAHFNETLVAGGHALVHLAGTLIVRAAFGLGLVDARPGFLDQPAITGGCAFDHQTGALSSRAAIALPQATPFQFDEATVTRRNAFVHLARPLVQRAAIGLRFWLGFRFRLRLGANTSFQR